MTVSQEQWDLAYQYLEVYGPIILTEHAYYRVWALTQGQIVRTQGRYDRFWMAFRRIKGEHTIGLMVEKDMRDGWELVALGTAASPYQDAAGALSFFPNEVNSEREDLSREEVAIAAYQHVNVGLIALAGALLEQYILRVCQALRPAEAPS